MVTEDGDDVLIGANILSIGTPSINFEALIGERYWWWLDDKRSGGIRWLEGVGLGARVIVFLEPPEPLRASFAESVRKRTE